MVLFIRQKKLKIPENIKLVFLPPYSPELLVLSEVEVNPAEKIWGRFKRAFTTNSLNRWKKSVF